MTALNGPTSNSAPSTVASATKSDDQYSQPPASPSPRLDLDAASPSAVSGAVNPTASPTAATAAPKAAVEAKTAPVTSETSVKVGLDIQNPVGASSHESPLQSHKSAPITVSPAIVEPENQSRKEQISTHIELQKQEEEQAQTQTQTQTQTEPESQNQQMEQKQKQGLGHESSEAPLFQSSIPSASVRDFAYPPDHSLYYGALPTLADKKRNSESATGDPRADEDDDEMSPSSWDPEAMYSHMSAVKLPAMSFADGPPFNDGEDYDDYGSSGMYYFSKAQQGRGLEGDEFAGDMALDGVPADEYITGSPYGEYFDTDELCGKAVALFDFESEHESELPLKEGQIIIVSYRHGEGWLVAEDPSTGQRGLVPEDYVRLVRDIEGEGEGEGGGGGGTDALNAG